VPARPELVAFAPVRFSFQWGSDRDALPGVDEERTQGSVFPQAQELVRDHIRVPLGSRSPC